MNSSTSGFEDAASSLLVASSSSSSRLTLFLLPPPLPTLHILFLEVHSYPYSQLLFLQLCTVHSNPSSYSLFLQVHSYPSSQFVLLFLQVRFNFSCQFLHRFLSVHSDPSSQFLLLFLIFLALGTVYVLFYSFSHILFLMVNFSPSGYIFIITFLHVH